MNACWHPDPEKRPQFKEIVKRIERAQKARIFDTQDREEATTFGNKGATSLSTPPHMCCTYLSSVRAVQIELSELEVGQQIGHGTLCKYVPPTAELLGTGYLTSYFFSPECTRLFGRPRTRAWHSKRSTVPIWSPRSSPTSSANCGSPGK